jgi:hypothetical protein
MGYIPMLYRREIERRANKYGPLFFIAPRLGVFVYVLLLVSVALFGSYYDGCVTAEESSYVPAAPSGPQLGFINISYEYSIATTNPDALWMFDWGDGTFSDWVSLKRSEQSVVQFHSWNSSGIYSVRIKYKSSYFGEIWSPYLEVTITEHNESDYPSKPTVPSGKPVGTVNLSYSYSTYATDGAGDKIQYRFNWGDGTISGWSSLGASGAPSTMSHSWTHAGTFSVTSQARDVYGLDSPWSDPVNVTVEPDSDGDGLADTIELSLGSNPQDSHDVNEITLGSVTHYIVLVKDDGVKLFYNTTIENSSALGSAKEGTYLVDDDLDGDWEYSYDPLFDTVVPYEKPHGQEKSFEIPLLWIIIGVVIVVILLVIFILFKKGYIYIYEEYVAEE